MLFRSVGLAREEVSCSYTGPEITLAVNFAYLSEPLRVIGTDVIVIKFTEPTKALSIHAQPEKEFFHIIMPMNLNAS